MNTFTLVQKFWKDSSVMRETASLDGAEQTLVDTAVLRDTPHEIEERDIRRARANLAPLIVDAHTTARALDASRAECPPRCARLVVRDKIDLADAHPRVVPYRHRNLRALPAAPAPATSLAALQRW